MHQLLPALPAASNGLIHVLQTVPEWAVYALVALAIGVESIGIPVPGETTLAAAAVMSAHHELDISPWMVGAAGATGAIIGDSIGYWVGREYGKRLLLWMTRKFPKHVDRDHLVYASHVFDRYGVFAVFFGRFIALLRILAGPLAGSMGMHYPRFLLANALGGIVWAGGLTWVIVTLGTAAEHYLKQSAWIALVAFVVIALVAGRLMARKIDANVRAYCAQRRREEGKSEDEDLEWGAQASA